jgi:hypothetical protein
MCVRADAGGVAALLALSIALLSLATLRARRRSRGRALRHLTPPGEMEDLLDSVDIDEVLGVEEAPPPPANVRLDPRRHKVVCKHWLRGLVSSSPTHSPDTRGDSLQTDGLAVHAPSRSARRATPATSCTA